MSQRIEKVQKLARQVLGELIHDLKDPRIGFATVTAVRITRDLHQAKVFVSILGTDDEQTATMDGLESAKSFLRTELGRQIRTKYTPELIFEHDHLSEEARRLEELIQKIHEPGEAS